MKRILLFNGMNDFEIAQCLNALGATQKKYKADEIILHSGETTSSLGIVLQGSVTIESSDIWGNYTLLSRVDTNGFFAETYAVLQHEVLLVDVRANVDSTIMFLNLSALFSHAPYSSATAAPSWENKFKQNLLKIAMSKNLTLSKRNFHTTPKTIRERVLSYLNAYSLQTGSATFTIPFDRQELADYLNVDRTALSKELSKMRSAGLLSFHKSTFTLHELNES